MFITVYFMLHIFSFLYHELNAVEFPLYSSIWCSSTLNNTRKCVFRNLCYNMETKFIFILSDRSFLSGVGSSNDFKHFYSSSLTEHSALPLKISIVNRKELIPKIKLFVEDAILLHRFKPDNLMHVIHDDLLPLYSTFMELCLGNISRCASSHHLFFSDENVVGPFSNWYEAFSRETPVQLSQMDKSVYLCFKNVHVGLSQDSIFYDYGFLQARGKHIFRPRLNILLHGFKTYMLNHFKIKETKENFHKVVFLSRKLNRRILNEKFVVNAIKTEFRNKFNALPEVYTTDLVVNSITDILYSISSAHHLIGIHGAAMILAIFLPSNSTVLELFPYGLKKEGVSPLYTMSLIPDMHFKYISWGNKNDLNTFPHPEYPSIYGGIHEFTLNEKLFILNLSNIPSYKCCSDPVFLSRMYQDTVVDDTIYETLKFFFSDSKIESPPLSQEENWFFPSFVHNISCIRNSSGLFVSWSPPFNILSFADVSYKVHLETPNGNLTLYTNSTSFHVKIYHTTAKLWIMCSLDGVDGIDSFSKC